MKLFFTLTALLLLSVSIKAQENANGLKLQAVQMTKAEANIQPIKDLNLSDNDRLAFQQIADDYKIKLIQVLTDSQLNDAGKKSELDLVDFAIQKKLNNNISGHSSVCEKYLKTLRDRAEKEGTNFLMADRFSGEGCKGCGKLN